MQTYLPWVALLLGCIGNCGFWLFCFNRVNAFGYPRPIAKVGEKLCMLFCFAIPAAVFIGNSQALFSWLAGSSFWPAGPISPLSFWMTWNLASLCVLAPLWLESRRWLIPPRNLLRTDGRRYNVHQAVPGGSAADASTRRWARLPLNEWAHLEVTQKVLRLPRKISGAEGLTIGHLSDLHFTGQYREEHYRFIVDRLSELSPDLIAISGDMIDFQHCLPMAERVLGDLKAPLGVYFVLGNHEKRLTDVRSFVDRLTARGLFDLGANHQRVQRGSLSIWLLGNERPWFDRRCPKEQVFQRTGATGPVEFGSAQCSEHLRLAVAHTPDCIGWARSLACDLMLAGHTHGGQVRLPGIGPIVAPSHHGSKFASGVFLLPPTLMHVSRGVAGTHTIRWRCPPEVSVLRLTNKDA
jgi:uncharacterized protein